MNAPDSFEIVGRRAFYRPIATVSFAEGVNRVANAIAYARDSGASELLANICCLTGSSASSNRPPNMAERYFVAEKWALATGGRVRVAVVARAEMIDPYKFGVTVAANRGAVGNVFVTEVEALAWLDGAAGTTQAQTPSD